MTKKIIEDFLLNRTSYLKNSPIVVAQALWKASPKHTQAKTTKELQKELDQIREVQQDLRRAKTIETEQETTKLTDIYQKILDYKNKPKRILLFDLEVSGNIVFTWRIGREVNLTPDDIIHERAIICVAYKWLHDPKTYCIEWDKGNDKQLLEKFSKIIDSADVVVGQNSSAFDVKWLRTRCIKHNIPLSPKYNEIDTLKMARANFKFNSNKLNYLGEFLGVGNKIKTEYDLWKKITLENHKPSMDKMKAYCIEDVNLLERVYLKLEPFSPKKTFKYKI